MEQYYYNQLEKEKRSAWVAIENGLKNLAPSFSVPRLEARDLADIYAKIRMDCPEIFYTVNYKYRYYPESTNVELIPEYIFDKKKMEENRKALHTRVEKLSRPVKGMGERDQLLYIHDFMCQKVLYDKLKKAYSHEIIGPLGHGVGVCEGISKAVKALCDELGIWCMIAVSEKNPEKGHQYRHAWNVVRCEGHYYHMDATFDNTLSKKGKISRRYFLLSDRQIFKDHEPAIWKLPACDREDRYRFS